jgi:hypothetical protein
VTVLKTAWLSRKATLPVAFEGVTVAVKVTAWPGEEEVDETVRTVVLVDLVTVSVTGLEVLAPFLESPL